jgi:hypothetical protein
MEQSSANNRRIFADGHIFTLRDREKCEHAMVDRELSANVTHITASRVLLKDYIDAKKAPHLIPIATAIKDHDCALSIVFPYAGPFRLPADRPVILIIGDDHKICVGPSGFHQASLRRFVKTCRVAGIVSCAPPEQLYRTVVNDAVYLRRNIAIIETQAQYEADWYACLTKIKPNLSLAVGLVRPEGHA